MSAQEHSTVDVLVIGGGIVGMTAAWRAVRAGLSVTVLDPAPGCGATHAAAGMLAAVTESDFGEERLARLNVDSAGRWPGFAAELEASTGIDVGLARTGTLTVAYDADDAAEVRRLVALQHGWGLPAEPLSVAEARRRAPLLGAVAGAVWVPDDHQVDPRATHRALHRAVTAGQCCAVVQRAARSLLRARPDGPVGGAVDETGHVWRAGVVVLAAGDRSPALLSDVPEVHAPVRPVKGLTLRLDAEPWFELDHVVRGRVQGRPVYVVPRAPRPDGSREVVIGATSDEKPDDRRAEAGGVFALLRDSRALVPAIDELALVEVTPRVRPTAPDNLPYLGESGLAGLVLATGHHRNGVLLAPVTAAAIDAVLTGAPVPDAVAAVDPARFAPEPWKVS